MKISFTAARHKNEIHMKFTGERNKVSFSSEETATKTIFSHLLLKGGGILEVCVDCPVQIVVKLLHAEYCCVISSLSHTLELQRLGQLRPF